MFVLARDDKQEEVYVHYAAGTVGTKINHPTQGRRLLYRRRRTMEQLAAILQHPRVHTGKPRVG